MYFLVSERSKILGHNFCYNFYHNSLIWQFMSGKVKIMVGSQLYHSWLTMWVNCGKNYDPSITLERMFVGGVFMIWTKFLSKLVWRDFINSSYISILNVNFENLTIRLYVLIIFFIFAKFQEVQRLITISSYKC